jgi:DNA-directed RNA polymerase specialized sigma24 family protein
MSSLTADARDELRRYVAHPRTRSSLTAYVRRWGLADAADDVVQTVLCDALAAPAIPVPAPDIPRWVGGIAKKKVADERRRRARWQWVELPESAVTSRPEVADLLKRIDREVVEPEQRRSLGLLLREHAGESLLEIARELALEPPALRQRICRLRQKLRARYLGPLILLLGLGGASALAHQRGGRPATSLVAPAALAAHQGSWRVIRAAPSRYSSLGLHVMVEGDVARVRGPTVVPERILSIRTDGANRFTLSSGASVWNVVLEARDADHLLITGERGFVELERER